MKKETIALIALLLVAFVWGSAFIAIEMALKDGWGTFSILTVRGLVGGLVTLPFAIKSKFWKNTKGIICAVVMGILFFAAFYFQTEGQAKTTIGNAAFLTGLYVVFAPLVLRIFFKERQLLKVYIGCMVALVGVFFLTVLSEGGKMSFNIGDVLVIISAFFFSLQIILAEKSAKYCNAITSTSIMLLTMGTLSLIFMSGSLIFNIGNESGIKFDLSILPVLYCAIFSSALASFGQIAAQKYISSSKASIIMAQEALLATIMGAFYYKELPNLFVYIGGSLMIISILIIELKINRKLILNKFEYILLDVDDTLLNFQKSQDESIKLAYKNHNVELTDEMLNKYKEINHLLWQEFEKNLITTNEIFNERFNKLNKLYNLDIDGHNIESMFRNHLNTSWFLMDSALEFLNKVKDNYNLVIVTNGKKETQKSRLSLSGIDKYFKHIFISEEVGYKKPELEFFLHLEKSIPNFNKEKAIIIGDSLTSDIQGGINYGIKTCFYNSNNIDIKHEANYMINSFDDIVL